jgi:uncharacterized protein (PEP-CTERM system associated)
VSFDHRTRRTLWALKYKKDLETSVQREIDKIKSDIDGHRAVSVINYQDTNSLTNEIFLSNTLVARMTKTNPKSSIGLGLFGEERETQLTLSQEKIVGSDVLFEWQLFPRTKLELIASYQKHDYISLKRRDNVSDTDFSLIRNLTRKATGRMVYTYTKRDSTEESSVYVNNSIRIQFDMQF